RRHTIAKRHWSPDVCPSDRSSSGLANHSGEPEWLARPEDEAATPMRMNDGCCDAQGRFWAGSMAYDGTPGAGSIYRTDPDGKVKIGRAACRGRVSRCTRAPH